MTDLQNKEKKPITNTDPCPLVVDLDGSLIRSDILIESVLSFIKNHPFQFLAPLKWLLLGKANLKLQLARRSSLDVSVLPYNQEVIDLIKQKKAKVHKIILATASYQSYATQVSEHLGLFDQVMATDGKTNLSAYNKRNALIKVFGEKGFDYIGNSKDDFPIWEISRKAYVVNPESGVESRAKKIGNVEKVIHSPNDKIKTWAKALRFHQWMKNVLIFVPLFASHQVWQFDLLINGFLAFVFFGLCASSVYIFNDLLDLEDDRHHEKKRNRPFASGRLPLKYGLIAFPFLLIIGFSGASFFLPWKFSLVLMIYYIFTLFYSFFLKRVMTIDVIVLSALYTLRIVAGSFAFEIDMTFWMLAFSMFIFLSLALVKRYAELREARVVGTKQKTRGRGYYPDDLEMIASLGASSGYLSVMVLALYIQDKNTAILYSHPKFIWMACPVLLFWISRTWMLTHRGKMHNDPIVFAIKDRISLITGFLFGLIFLAAI